MRIACSPAFLMLVSLILPATEAVWPLPDMQPAFLWKDAAADNTVAIPGRARPRDCRLASIQGGARIGYHGEMVLQTGACYADLSSARRVLSSVAEQGQLSVECVLRPLRASQDGLVLSLDGDGQPAFALQQQDTDLVLLYGAQRVPLFTLAQAPQHVLVSCGPGGVRAYAEGELVHEQALIDWEPASWRAQGLVFGGAWDLSRNWQGTLQGVALYPQSLSAEQARAHAAYWRQQLDARQEPERIRLRGRLLGASQPADASSYPRSLVAFRYAVDQVLAGDLDAEHVVVFHWGVLGGERQPVLERGLRATYELDLVPVHAYPSLEAEHRSEDVFDPDAPVLVEPGY